jgi:hypothetical protein
MKQQKEALYLSHMAQEVAECVRARLPEIEQHACRVYDLAGQLLFPASQAGRSLRLIVGGLSASAVFVLGWVLPSPGQLWAAPPSAYQIELEYRAMRERVKLAVRDQTMPRVLTDPDGKCYRVTFARRAGDPFVQLRIVDKKREVPREDCVKAIEEAASLATDG